MPYRLWLMIAITFSTFSNYATAGLITYSWSGFVEPELVSENPWILSGDGSLSTLTDGTPFEISVYVLENAVDLDIQNGNQARFSVVDVDLRIGGNKASVDSTAIEGPRLSFIDRQAPEYIYMTVRVEARFC